MTGLRDTIRILGSHLTDLRREVAYRRGRDQRPQFPSAFDERRAVFIHVPKTAGISVALAIFGREVGHWRIRDLERLDRDRTHAYFKFAFTRNPWDRVVSAWAYLERGGQGRSAADFAFRNEVLRRYPTFTSFVRGWLTSRNVYRNLHFVPQHEFVCNGRGKSMMDFLGRYERLADDFAKITRSLELDVTLSHRNASAHDVYSSYYTDETRTIVRDVYRRDVEIFGYEFDR